MASKEAVLRPEDKGKAHSAQMPKRLARRVIQYCSNEGDLIVDPFCGSGTSLLEVKRLNRRGIGIDSSPESCQLSVSRLAAAPQAFAETA